MASFQSLLTADPTGFIGDVARSGETKRESLKVPSGGLEAGRVVMRNATTLLAQIPANDADVIDMWGVTLRDGFQIVDTVSGKLYGQNQMVPVLRNGYIWAETVNALTVTAPIFVVHTGADAGKLSATDDANTGPIPVGSIQVIEPATAAGKILVRVNL